MAQEQASHKFTAPSRLAFLPGPFEWIYIPSGTVQMRLSWGGEWVKAYDTELEHFYMAKYPVTNAQYAVYVQDTGEKPRDSHYWRDPNFNQPLQPVIYLNWQEAMQFCRWASEKAGFLITLPTDAQWQWAASGDDDRLYPWGNDWDGNRCNSQENGIHNTTPVTHYPEGASPYGVMDMVGNGFEWCLTNPNTLANSLDIDVVGDRRSVERIFKGSSYNSAAKPSNATLYRRSVARIDHSIAGIRLVTGILANSGGSVSSHS